MLYFSRKFNLALVGTSLDTRGARRGIEVNNIPKAIFLSWTSAVEGNASHLIKSKLNDE